MALMGLSRAAMKEGMTEMMVTTKVMKPTEASTHSAVGNTTSLSDRSTN